MPGNFRKEDLRLSKTYNSLQNALIKLLESRNFNRITVNDICEEAQLSRATFYARFKDKYDLLEYCLEIVEKMIIKENEDYSKLEKTINRIVSENSKVIINLLQDANQETIGLIKKFIYLMLDQDNKNNKKTKDNNEYIILTQFCIGGILNCLQWQTKNKFPENLPMMNIYFYSIVMFFINWYNE